MNENNSISGFLIFTFFVALILAFYVIFQYFSMFSANLELSTDQEIWAWFGDYLGGILSPIFAFAALIALLYSIHLQNNELRNSTEQLKKSAGALENQNRLIQKQNFEATYFHLLELYNRIIQELSITDRDANQKQTTYNNRQCFSILHHTLELFLHKQIVKSAGEISHFNAYQSFRKEYDYLIGHYFKSIYNIIEFIDNSDISSDEKIFYAGILQAQLSTKELIFINYDSNYITKDIRPLIEKYQIFISGMD